MRQRSNLIVVLGAAVFIVGVAITFLILNNNTSSANSSSGPKVTILFARSPIPQGTQGAALVNAVQPRTVPLGQKPATAISTLAELSGKATTRPIAAGEALVLEQFSVPATALGTINIPKDKQALAIQLGTVPGAGGFAAVGDKIDIYGVTPNALGGIPAQGGIQVHLVMQGIEVLRVDNATQLPSAAQGAPSGTAVVYLLAVSPQQAEQLIYLSTFQALYFALVSKDSTPVGPTAGAGAATRLTPVP